MNIATILGIAVVVLAGLAVGVSPWPIKCMRKYQYEHWGFIAMLIGFVAAPWLVVFFGCPDFLGAYASVESTVLLKSNLFSLSWGLANILYMLCFVRIGVSLTNGILTGIGASLGVVAPMVFKGSGIFQAAPDLWSMAGGVIVGGVAVMLFGVGLLSHAGLKREQSRVEASSAHRFRAGLLMAALAGILSAGISFAFVYSQGPILDAMKARGAADIPANVAVWAAGLLAGVAVNVLYPAYLMTKRKSWNVLWQAPGEIGLAVLFGLVFFSGFALMGKGMLLLGPLGASVGFGVQQVSQMLGGQAVGFISGEWRDADRKLRIITCYAIATLIIATAIMSFGNSVNSNY